MFNYGNPAPCGALLVILHWNTSRLRVGGRPPNRQTRCQCRCHTTNCYTYLYKWRCTNTLSGHFTFFLLVFIYLFFRQTTDRCPKQKPSSVFIGKSSRTLFFFSSVPLFLHSSFVLFLFCFLPFSLHSFVPSSFLLPSFLPSFLTLFLPYFVLVLASLGFTPLSLASLGSAVLDFTRLHSAQFGFARLFRPFLLGCVVRLLFYRTTICTSHVAMSSPAVLCRAA